MKLHERSTAKISLTPDEVLQKHSWATRIWFVHSRQRSKKALKLTPKAVMELCDWYEQDGKLVCVSKKTGRSLFWDAASMSWQPHSGKI